MESEVEEILVSSLERVAYIIASHDSYEVTEQVVGENRASILRALDQSTEDVPARSENALRIQSWLAYVEQEDQAARVVISRTCLHWSDVAPSLDAKAAVDSTQAFVVSVERTVVGFAERLSGMQPEESLASKTTQLVIDWDKDQAHWREGEASWSPFSPAKLAERAASHSGGFEALLVPKIASHVLREVRQGTSGFELSNFESLSSSDPWVLRPLSLTTDWGAVPVVERSEPAPDSIFREQSSCECQLQQAYPHLHSLMIQWFATVSTQDELVEVNAELDVVAQGFRDLSGAVDFYVLLEELRQRYTPLSEKHLLERIVRDWLQMDRFQNATFRLGDDPQELGEVNVVDIEQLGESHYITMNLLAGPGIVAVSEDRYVDKRRLALVKVGSGASPVCGKFEELPAGEVRSLLGDKGSDLSIGYMARIDGSKQDQVGGEYLAVLLPLTSSS